jgi:hypothetical protein
MKVLAICVLLLVGSVCGSAYGSIETPQKRVMIDAYHSLGSANPQNNMVALSKILLDFIFEERNEPITENLLKEYDVVMLVQPFSIMEDSEIDALVEFVRKGGGLIICGEHDIGWNDSSRSTYNRLTATFGIIFTSNAIDDPTDKAGCYCTPIVHNMTEHPITLDVSQITVYKPCALRTSGDAVVIARGDDDTRTVGADVIKGEDVIVVAVSEYERGRVVVIGTHTAFDDSFINLPDNQTFCVNVFAWVSEPSAVETGAWDTLEDSQKVFVPIAVVVVLLVAAIALLKRQQKQ